MDNLLTIIKIVGILQAAIIFILVILLYVAKVIFYLRDKKQAKAQQKMTDLLIALLEQKIVLNRKNIKFLKHNIFYLTKTLTDQADTLKRYVIYPGLISELSSKVLIPMARRFSRSTEWFERYLATLAYSYGFEEKDQKKLLKLTKDKIMMVSINAAMVVAMFYNRDLLNKMINIFSKGRRLQQTLYAEIIAKKSSHILPVIFERLDKEQNLKIRVFCYRLLLRIPHQDEIYKNSIRDLSTNNMELKLAALKYIGEGNASFKADVLYSLASDPDWQVRAIVAKNLASVKCAVSVTILSNMIQDRQWWVRINAANSLLHQGEAGLLVLTSQTPERDKYAYETAQAALLNVGTDHDL